MKKLLAVLLMAVMSVSLFAGCGTDPIYTDFENYLMVEMVEVNENYGKITAEAGNWGNLETDAELEASIKDVLLPLVDDSLAKLENINPETEEVKAIKDKFVAVMDAYKEGFTGILEGIQNVDEATMLAGNDKLNEGLALLDEYNAALESLAAEYDKTIEY